MNTCTVDYQLVDGLCENPLEGGIKTVLQPIIQMPQYFLDCHKSKYTIAVNFAYYPIKIPIEDLKQQGVTDSFFAIQSKSIVLRDDYNIREFISEDLLNDVKATGFEYDIHTLGRNAFNHCKLFEKIVTNEHGSFKIIAAPIPQVCEGPAGGVLFIFSDSSVCNPKDIENTFLIIGCQNMLIV